MELNKYLACSRAARKLVPADLVLRNAKIVNVFTDRVEEGNIAITRGMIVGIGDYQGKEEIDLQGQYVTSGFIDAHLHLESTLVNPQVLISKAEAARHHHLHRGSPRGGQCLRPRRHRLSPRPDQVAPAHVYVMIASCVPATSDGRQRLPADRQGDGTYLSNRRVLGLGEVMDTHVGDQRRSGDEREARSSLTARSRTATPRV